MKARTAEIGEFVEAASGPAFKSARFTDDPSDVPLIKGENIAQGYIAWKKSRYWPIGDTEEYERFGLVTGDIVLSMDRPWVTAGLKWARLKAHDPPSLLVQRVARLRAKPGLRQDFLTYVIGSGAFSEYVRNIMGGTNVPHISGSQIKAFKFQLPGEEEQAAIASILSAYDDLIENNRRRIALLEEAARLLYREWFVHFRFPGHEHVKITDGLPEGWSRRTLGSVLNLQRGFDLPVNRRISGGVPVYGSTGIVGEHNVAKVAFPTLVTGRSGSLGKVSFVDDPCWPLNTSLWVTDFKAVSVYFAYFVLSEMNLAKFNAGASVPTLDRKVAHSANVLVPTRNIAALFDEQVEILFMHQKLLDLQNQKLVQARDLLLPRLMSGKIAV